MAHKYMVFGRPGGGCAGVRASGLRAEVVVPVELSHPALSPLRTLLSYAGDYDDDFVVPTDDAVRTAAGLLRGVCDEFGGSGPRAVASTLGDGGLEVYFTRGNGEVTLSICPSGTEGAIVYARADEHGAEEGVALDRLIFWLRWLELW